MHVQRFTHVLQVLHLLHVTSCFFMFFIQRQIMLLSFLSVAAVSEHALISDQVEVLSCFVCIATL